MSLHMSGFCLGVLSRFALRKSAPQSIRKRSPCVGGIEQSDLVLRPLNHLLWESSKAGLRDVFLSRRDHPTIKRLQSGRLLRLVVGMRQQPDSVADRVTLSSTSIRDRAGNGGTLAEHK